MGEKRDLGWEFGEITFPWSNSHQEFWDELILAGLGWSRPGLNSAHGIPGKEKLGMELLPQIPEAGD